MYLLTFIFIMFGYFILFKIKKKVRIDGIAEKIPASASVDYFNSRPKDSQIAACVSCSSKKVCFWRIKRTYLFHEKKKYFYSKI